MCYLTQKVSAGGDWPLSVSHLRACCCGLSSPSDVMMAFTVKLSCIFSHVSVVKDKMRHVELPFPIVTAVLNLGFDECY